MAAGVWIAQCLCPDRHCILAAAGVAEGRAEAAAIERTLRDNVAGLLARRVLNPWCGLCRAPITSWAYELGRTRWRTMAEAKLALEEAERKQRLTAALLGEPAGRA